MNEWTEHLGESRQVQEINVINTNHHCHRAFHLQAQMQKKTKRSPVRVRTTAKS